MKYSLMMRPILLNCVIDDETNIIIIVSLSKTVNSYWNDSKIIFNLNIRMKVHSVFV